LKVAADAHALVIGAGPAGASAAILLARAGWRVILAEKNTFPRQKVCGECLTAGSLALLDELGVGGSVIERAGPELQRVGWMSNASTIVADLPPCGDGPYRYGRALGRDQLDMLLLERARALGVTVLQPAKVRAARGEPGGFECEIDMKGGHASIRAHIVIDGHGSWEPGPRYGKNAPLMEAHEPRKGSDLFGFKASYHDASLPRGLLPVLAFPGGYGGIVVAEHGRLTLAGCMRRDVLRACRARLPGASAGLAVENYIRLSCRGVREALESARRIGPWLTVGPLRPGIRIGNEEDHFRVGNTAGETHPLIGEGIGMALQSAFLLTHRLIEQPALRIDASRAREINRAYGRAWHRCFARRVQIAAVYAHAAMRPALAASAAAVLRRWPLLLTEAARFAGKAQSARIRVSLCKSNR